MEPCATGGGAVSFLVTAALHFFATSQCTIRESWPNHTAVENSSRFDFIVVGGGTAGSALAARLSELSDVSVLLIEAGGDPPQESIVPELRHVLKRSLYDWNFTTVNDSFSSQALWDGVQRQPRGKMLGGSGSLNDMVYARGFPTDYEEWAATVGDDWNWTTVLHYFKKSENLTDENIINNETLKSYHGTDGEIEVSGFLESIHATDRFLEAFRDIGFSIVNDMTNPHQIGAGRFSHTIHKGQRDGSLTGLLNKAKNRDNLYVLKNSLVTKILTENGITRGVQVFSGDDELQFFTNKEVIISAGTFNTAKLLLLSGIGPKDHLEKIGIKVVQDLPVGQNLHDHVMVMTYLAAEHGTCKSDEASNYMNVMKYLHDRTGSWARTNSMGAYFTVNNSLEVNVPDFAIYPTCIPKATNKFYENCISIIGFNEVICRKLSTENEEYELLSLAVVLLKPKSRGKVELKSQNPFDDPLIYSGTFNNLDDLDGFPEAIRKAWSLTNATYFTEKNAHVVDVDIENCKDLLEITEVLKCKVKAMATSAWHAVGTAAMGTVLDSRLRVNGVSGLRVADASVMMNIIRGNTNAPVIMIAERAADFIKEDYSLVIN